MKQNIQIVNTGLMELITIAQLLSALVAFTFVGKSKCGETAFASMTQLLAIVLALSAIFTTVLKVFSFLSYVGSKGKLPGILSSVFEDSAPAKNAVSS